MKTKQIIIIIVGISVSCIAIATFLLTPYSQAINKELPAVMIPKGTGQIENTCLSIDGEFVQKRISQKPTSYSGEFQIDSLKYTQVLESFVAKFEFQTVEGSDCLLGHCGYKDGELKYASVYTDKTLSCFIYFDAEYIVIAPADSMEDVYTVCDKLGVEYPLEK